mmetsp:Transcript_69753/g.204566  ORF Transcript_69753/g.204566 Transcript_69753/m.204566 type:complete len:244 (-) Transcript_69753:88-819(-)
MVCRLRPLEPLMASAATAGSTPKLCRAKNPSAPSRRWAQFRELLIAFTACPAPAGPHLTTLPANALTTGSTFSAAASSLAPSMHVRVPAAAPLGPPLTGQSTKWRPKRSSSDSASFLDDVGSPDVQETMQPPAAMELPTSSATSASSTEVGRQKTTTLAFASPAAVSTATLPCSAAWRWALSPSRFQTRHLVPGSFDMCAAICHPMAPRPAKPTSSGSAAELMARQSRDGPGNAGASGPKMCQ